jgi:hypothetical protein
MEERRMCGGKQVDLLEPRPSVADSDIVGLGMAGLNAMVIEGRV